MHLKSVIVCIFFIISSHWVNVYAIKPSPSSKDIHTKATTDNLAGTTKGCVELDDGLCLLGEELSNYEAIKSLHKLLDDDMSGEIDMNESVDFLKGELTITDGYNSRQKNLHNNSDRFISVADLWRMWKRSAVHNWTVEETATWMKETVGLSQYAVAIIDNNINGSCLPRLTVNKSNFLVNVLGIKGLSHRTKVTVKAMDAVLFGPPKGSHTKDILIVSLATVIIMGIAYIYHRHRQMADYHSNLFLQIEELRSEEAKYRLQLTAIKDKANDSQAVSTPDSGVGADASDVSSNNTEDTGVPSQESEYDYDSNNGSVTPPSATFESNIDRESLKFWLRKTYEKERLTLENKYKLFKTRFDDANEYYQKLRSQGKNPLSLFTLMHGKVDNLEKNICLAKGDLLEVLKDDKERQDRWGEIERLMDCNIRGEAELLNIMGSLSSLQTPSDSNNIVSKLLGSQSALMFLTMGGCSNLIPGGGDAPSPFTLTKPSPLYGAASPTDRLRNHAGLRSATTYPFTSYRPESMRNEDYGESVSLPRTSSMESSSVNRLLPSMSQSQLSDSSTTTSKKTRRNKPSNLVRNVPCTNATTGQNDNQAMFSMGGSPLVMPNKASEESSAVTTPEENAQECSGDETRKDDETDFKGVVTGTSPIQYVPAAVPTLVETEAKDQLDDKEDPTLKKSPSTVSDNSHHRPLSQIVPGSTSTLPSTQRKKKKSFFGRLTGSRKSFSSKMSLLKS